MPASEQLVCARAMRCADRWPPAEHIAVPHMWCMPLQPLQPLTGDPLHSPPPPQHALQAAALHLPALLQAAHGGRGGGALPPPPAAAQRGQAGGGPGLGGGHLGGSQESRWVLAAKLCLLVVGTSAAAKKVGGCQPDKLRLPDKFAPASPPCHRRCRCPRCRRLPNAHTAPLGNPRCAALTHLTGCHCLLPLRCAGGEMIDDAMEAGVEDLAGGAAAAFSYDVAKGVKASAAQAGKGVFTPVWWGAGERGCRSGQWVLALPPDVCCLLAGLPFVPRGLPPHRRWSSHCCAALATCTLCRPGPAQPRLHDRPDAGGDDRHHWRLLQAPAHGRQVPQLRRAQPNHQAVRPGCGGISVWKLAR